MDAFARPAYFCLLLTAALLASARPAVADEEPIPPLAPGDILLVTGQDGRVIRVDPVSGEPTILATSGLWNSAVSIAATSDGLVFICCGGESGRQIIEWDPATGAQRIVVDFDESFRPRHLGLTASGDLFVGGYSLADPEADWQPRIMRLSVLDGVYASIYTTTSFYNITDFDVSRDGQTTLISYIDNYDGDVLKLNGDTADRHYVTKFEGSGNPRGVALAANEDVYIAGYTVRFLVEPGGEGYFGIWKIDHATSVMTRVSGGGLLHRTSRLRIEPSGNLLILGEIWPTPVLAIIRVDSITGEQSVLSPDPAPDAVARFASLTVVPEPTLPSPTLDIQPGRAPNVIDLAASLPQPVAILASDAVDVTSIDIASLRFGPAAVAPAVSPTDPAGEELTFLDVNGDERLDLIAFFWVQDSGISPNDMRACLTGELATQPFRSCDSVEPFVRSCGLGFEVAGLLPLLTWLRRRQRPAATPTARNSARTPS